MPLFLIGLCGLLVMVLKTPAAAPVKVTGNLLQIIGTGAGAIYLGVAAGAFERDEPARQGWLRLALAMGANSLGFVVYGVMELAGAEELFPSVADFFWLITYPLALWAIIHLARQYC
ncbi:MAG TPA: hypothetical protein VNT26_09470, partial [Candidatus Sulfotelmatobacter sp.]|nr:hypothetical protein [Candidatus Sulfotelmatobacter sp.]